MMPEDITRLIALGWDDAWKTAFDPWQGQGLIPGRVTVEEKHHYRVGTAEGEFPAQLTGRLLGQNRRAALPKVGDWAAVQWLSMEQKVMIHGLLERRSQLRRKMPGRHLEVQVLAANVDKVFIVQGLDRPLNAGLLQRYLVMAYEGGVAPVVLLNKSDRCAALGPRIAEAQQVAGDTPVLALSAVTGEGIDTVRNLVQPRDTFIFVGASGVGKSSILNRLYGEEIQAISEVRAWDAQGRHTTSWRELIVLPHGGCVIDTPGMREFQVWATPEGLQQAFGDIQQLAAHCRFRDCRHVAEQGCAVIAAFEKGELSPDRYQHYLKLMEETDDLSQARAQPSRARRHREPSSDPPTFPHRKNRVSPGRHR